MHMSNSWQANIR